MNKIYIAARSLMVNIIIVALSVFSFQSGYGQTVVINPASPWTVPAGVTSIKVEVWGGGGGGGGAYWGAGGGGGGGAYHVSTLTVSSGQIYTITIGSGGSVGNNANGGTGGQTTFTGIAGTVTANGGSGGLRGNVDNSVNGGGGGSGGTNVGGNGGNSNGNGAGGGGGAGNGAGGLNGSNTIGGIGGIGTYAGGNGGNFITSNGPGNSGSAPGGGGGGARSVSSTSQRPGGAGGAGYIVITYTACATPSVTTQPLAQSICTGGNVTFSVTAAGTAPLSYQWRRNGTDITGATSSSYSITGVTGTDAANYSVYISNTCGNITSNNAALTISTPASITTGPVSDTKCVGGTASFSVTATGGPLTYQWQKNNVNITGATSANYTTPALVAGDNNATYKVIVTSAGCGSVTSAVATLTVNVPAAITTQPSSQSICAGSPVTFSVATTGTPPLTYQWKKGGVDITGEINASYSIASVAAGDAGSYTVTITNICNSVTSSAATLTVSTPASITTDPANQIKCVGATASFSVVAGGGPLTYQWQKNNVNIVGATSANYTTPALVAGDNNATYKVIVTSAGCGSVTSAVATLTVNVPAAISTQPSSQSICAGGPVTFSVATTGTPPLSYQWKKGGVDITGETNASYSIASVAAGDAGSYTVAISNICNSVTSSAATLTVNTPTSVTTDPVAQSKCVGETASFSVVASGSPLTFQWQKNNVNIVGATSANYTTPALIAGDNGATYKVIITVASCGSVTSASAVLTVNTPPAITTQPTASQIICLGTPASFTVAVTGSPAPTFQWRKNGTDISGATSATYTIPSVVAGDAATYSVVVTNTCSTVTSSNAVLVTTSVGSWIGVTSNNWFTATNWGCGQVPDATTDVTIPAVGSVPNQPSIGAAGAVCRNITINGTLTTTTTNNLDVYGDWTNNGAFTNNTGSITFRGGTGNILAGSSTSTFYNLVVNKTATANTITSTTKAFTATNLTVTQGNLILQANDANYTVSNNITVASNGILTHSVNWDTAPNRLLSVGGDIAIDGIFNYTTRSHVQMTGSKTVYTGTNPASAFSILTLTASGNITAAGNLTVNDNFWAMFGSTGSFTTGTNTVTANAGLLNSGGTIIVNGGTLNVIGGISVSAGNAGVLNFSLGTINADAISVGTATTGTLLHSGGTINLNGSLTITGNGTYTASNSPIINITGNWTNNKTFTAGGSQVNFIGTTLQTIGGTSSTTFNNFKIANVAGASIATNATVNSTLDLTNGLITTPGANVITVATAGSIINASAASYINGKLARGFATGPGSKVFPIGKGGNYRPLTFGYTASSAVSTITAEQFEAALGGTITPATTTLYNARYWEITKTGTGSVNYTVTLDPTGFTPSGLVKIIKKEGVSAALTATAATTPNYTNATGFTTFNSSTTASGTNDFALASDCSSTANAGTSLAAICQGGTSSALGGSVSGTATGGSWDDGGVGGTFNSGATNLNTTWTAPALYFGTVTFTLTPTGGICTPNTTAFKTLLVNGDATIALTSVAGTTTQTVCINTGLTSISYQLGGGATGATLTGAPGGVTGSYNSGTKIYTVSGSPAASGNFTYTVTTTGPCVKPALGGTITVTPNATITFTSTVGTDAQSLCTNQPITNITYSIGGSGTGATVAGLPAGVTGNYAGNIYTISGTPTVTGTFNYTVTTTGPCVKPIATGSITTITVPTGSLTANETSGTPDDNIICAGSTVKFTAPAFYAYYNFYRVGANDTLQRGTSNILSTSTLVNGDQIAVIVANSSNCATTFGPITITVIDLPTPTLSADKASICPGDMVTFTAGPVITGYTYNFKFNGSSVQSGISNTFSTTSFTAANNPVTVDVTNNNGCIGTSSPVTVTINPLPSGTLTSAPFTTATTASICDGGSITFTATPAGYYNYNFKVNGTSIQSNGTNTFTPTSLTNPSVVTVDVTNISGGCTTPFNAIAVTVNPLPTGTIAVTENSGVQNNNEICLGSSVTYTFSNSTYNTYVWKINGTTQFGSTNIFTTPNLLATTDQVSVTVTSGSGCTTIFNASAVTIVPSPTGTLSVSPSNSICYGDNVVFTVATLDPTFTYTFKVNGTTVQTGLGNNTYTTTTLAVGTYPVTVDITNSSSCVTTTNAISMTVNALPTSIVTPKENYGTADNGIICEGGTVIFTVPTGFTNYNFILNNVSVQNGSSPTFNNSDYSITLVTGDKVKVAITNAGGCIGLTNEVTITVNPLPVLQAITDGAPSVCVSSLTPAFKNTTASGTWSVTNGTGSASITSGGVATGLTPGNVTINYTFTNGNGCSATVNTTLTVNAPPTVAPITGNVNVCTNTTSQFADVTTGITNVWSSDNTSVATVDPNTGLVSGVASGTATISYMVTDANGCSTTVSIVITVSSSPLVSPITTTATSGFNVCIGGMLALKDATSGGTWSSIDMGVATISPTGVVTGLTSGTTEIRYTISTTCSQDAYVSEIITVNAPPSAAISYNSGNPICSTVSTASVLQSGTTGGTYSYTGAGTLTLATDGTITPLTSTPGTYSVIYTIPATATGGCGIYTTTASVTITPLPTITSFGYSGTPYCSTVTSASPNLVASSTSGTYSYTVTSGGPTLSINSSTGVINPSTSSAGTYDVTYTIAASGGCALVSKTTSVTITAAPSATISYGPLPFCLNGGTASVNQTGTPGGAYSKTSGAGTLSLNSSTGEITLGTSTAGTYIVTYTVAASGGCSVYTTTTSVTVDPLPTATISGTSSVCQNGTSSITFTGADGTAPYTFTYNINGSGTFTVTSVGNVATVNPPTNAIGGFTYNLVSVKDASASACSQNQGGSATITVVTPIPVPAITASPSSLCLGGTSNLTIASGTSTDLISEDFEGTNTFSVVNTGTAASAWKSRTSVYNYYRSSSANANFNSGSKFMLANSDEGRALTNTALISPTVNTMGYSALTLTYRTYFRKNSSELAVVEVSTNGGSSWTVVQSHTSSTGSSQNFSTQTLDLSGYINNSSVIIRFRYSGNNEWWWAIDDVALTAASPLYSFSWSASPAANAGLPAGATIPSPSNTSIVINPTASGSFIYTASLTNAGCTTTRPITVVVNPLPVVTITADYCAVAGKVRLTASGTSGVTYSWLQGGATTQSIDVDEAGDYDVTASFGAPTFCSATATITVAKELVINGDFEDGDGVGFTTLYTSHTGNYYAGNQANNGVGSGLWPEGDYAVDKSAYGVTNQNPKGYHPDFHGRDHTTGSGNFMMVNGAIALKTIWQETVQVLPNTTYYFSAWGMNLNPGSPAELQFSVNGVPAGNVGFLSTAPVKPTTEGMVNLANWIRFYGTWVSGPTTTSAVINIINNNTIGGGNDFGLDDISFGTLSTFIRLESTAGTDAQTPCINTAITPIVYSVGSSITPPIITPALPNGLTSSFNGIFFTISGTPTVAGNYAYTITTTGSCKPSTATGTINVQTQTIALTSGSNAPLCINTALPQLVYTVGGTATGASITGGSLPAGVGGSYDIPTKTFNITGTPTEAGVFNYTITTTGTCTPATINGTITVTEQTITLNSANNVQTTCINTGIANIQYTIGGTGSGVVLPVAGLPAGVSGSYNSGILFISGTPTVSGTFNYTVTTSGTCAAVTALGTINVTPNASLTLTSASGTDGQTLCVNTGLTNITYSVNNATYASAAGLPAGVTGSFAAGTPGVFTISGIPTAAAGTYNFTVTTTGGCGTGTATGSITVQSQTVTLTSGSTSPTVCINTAMTDIVYTIGGTATGASLSGQPAGVTGLLSGNTFTISGTPTVAGPFNYTVTLSGSCATIVSATGTITVSSAAIGGTLTSVSICDGISGTLTLAGNSNNPKRWEYSDNGGTTWVPVANTTISLTYPALTSGRQYRAIVGNNCGDVPSSIALVGIHNLWTGATSTDWNTPGNWSDNLVPSTSCPTVTIPVVPTNRYPVLSSGLNATIINLDIKANASLIISGNTIQIAGTVTSANPGAIDASNGTIEFNGSAVAQTISGSVFKDKIIKDLTISNTSGLNLTTTLTDTLNITGAVNFGVTSSTFTTNDNLTLKSTTAGTASVGVLGANNDITGDVNVERFIPTLINHGKSWQLLAIPTHGTQSVKSAWQETATSSNVDFPLSSAGNPHSGYGTMITSSKGATPSGARGLGFDEFTSPGPSMKTYVSSPAGYDGGPASTSVPIYSPKGYMVLVRGDRSVSLYNQAAVQTTLRTKGPLFTPRSGNTPPTINVTALTFESVGNPYASAIDLTKLTPIGGVGPFYYVWDPKLGGAYSLGAFQTLAQTKGDGNFYPNPGGGSYGTVNDQHNYIESGQAFLISATGTNGSLSFKETDKWTASLGNTTMLRPRGNYEKQTELRTNLYSVNADGSTVLADGTLIQYNSSFSNDIDGLDARKMTNTSENLALRSGGKDLAVERRAPIVETDTVFYKLTTVKVQKYRYEYIANELSSFGVEGFIEDTYLGTKTPLNMDGRTTVDFKIENIPASYVSNRFRIVFKAAAGPLPVTFVSVKAAQKADDIEVEWKVENESNMKQYEVEKSIDGTNFANAGKVPGLNTGAAVYTWLDQKPTTGWNYYRIRSVDVSGKTQLTDVVKVLIAKITPAINVFPNPIVDGVLNLHLINQPAGKYGLRLLNPLGQVILAKQITHADGNSTEKLKWDYKLAHGTYQLEITKPDGGISVIMVMY